MDDIETKDYGQKHITLEDSSKTKTHLGKHLSKSASELNSTGNAKVSPNRTKSSVTPNSSTKNRCSESAGISPPVAISVLQKTHVFFSNLRYRWSRTHSKDRFGGRKLPNNFLEENAECSVDYSSENSSVTQTPRQRSKTISGLSLGKEKSIIKSSQIIQKFGNSMQSNINEDSINTRIKLVAQKQQCINLEAIDAADRNQKRETQLRKYSFFQLRVHLKNGKNLTAMDKNGLSDPYVKFKISGRLLHKSHTIYRDLNPIWDEVFVVPIENPFEPIVVKVFDYDWGLQDDFIGLAKIDLTQLELGKASDLNLQLVDVNNSDCHMGEILINLTLWPRSQGDKKIRNAKFSETSKRVKSQIWSSVVTILLVKSKNLPLAEDGNKLSDAHIKFRLGTEKYKSKSSWTERWLEQFDLHLFNEDQMLELSLWNRNINYGRATIDLSTFERETTHSIWKSFNDCLAEIFLMLTISGTTASETITDLKAFKEDKHYLKRIKSRYCLLRSFHNLRDVGHLTVKVFGAMGLAAADIGGKSDPFCVLELGNARLQTQTEYKTLSPNWNKIFMFNVKDITQILELTVYDEDRDHRVEFLGRLMIPLLRIRNGVKRRYTLKDKNLCIRAKGTSPQILLELSIFWNPLRAICRILQPKEEKLMQQEVKFKRQLFLHNVNRLKIIMMDILDAARYIQSCFEWENPLRSILTFGLWIIVCIYGSLIAVPIILLLIILKNWLIRLIMNNTSETFSENYDYYDDDDDDEEKEKEEKKSIKERLQTIQEVSQTVQNTIGFLASLAESTRNTLNFAFPELTWLAVFLLIIASFVLYYVPLRFILLFWGIIKFSRRILRPNSIQNNELLDFISRIPDNVEMNQYRELSPTAPNDNRAVLKKKYKPS